MASVNKCEPWYRAGLPCPYVFEEYVRMRRRKKNQDEEEEAFEIPDDTEVHEKVGEDVRQRVGRGINFPELYLPGRRPTDVGQGDVMTQADWAEALREATERLGKTILKPETDVPVPGKMPESEGEWKLPVDVPVLVPVDEYLAAGEFLGLTASEIAVLIAGAAFVTAVAFMVAGTGGAAAVPAIASAFIVGVMMLPSEQQPGGQYFSASGVVDTVELANPQSVGGGTWHGWDFMGTEG